MKKQYAFLFLFMVSMMITVSAQSTTDTVKIPGAQSLNISNIINADTSVTAFRVYVLDRGAIYYIDRAFELTHSCKFISVGDATKRPAVLAPAIRADDTSEEWYFKLVKTNISVELNDLYLLSLRSDGKALGWSRAIHIGASNTALKLRRVVFDGWTESGIRIDGADFVKLDVQDCHFRNFVHGTSYFGGQPFLSNHNDHPDTTIFINNTFFNCNSYLFSIRGLGPKSVFEHNTVCYTAVNPLLTRQADNTFIDNNLFYAAHAWGGDPEQRIGAWFLNYPDTVSSAIVLFREAIPYLYFDPASYTGPEAHYSDLGLTYDPHKRVFQAHNNVNFNPSKLVDFYTNWNATVTDYDSVEVITGPKQYLKRTLVMAPWLNALGKTVRDSMTDASSATWYSPTVDLEDAKEVDPQFSDAGVVGQLDNLIDYVRKIASRQLDNPWPYEFNFPPKWPLPENLSYTNAALLHAGTDGFAIGDLNWFPDQKAQWVENPSTDFTVANASFELPGNVKQKGWDNGGENEIPGWSSDTKAKDSGVEKDPNAPATDGSWTAFLMGSDPEVWQTLTKTISAGESYLLQVDSKITWIATNLELMLYYVDNGARVPLASKTVTITNDWQTFSLQVDVNTVPASIGKQLGIAFKNVTTNGDSWLGLDNVRLTNVPTGVKQESKIPTEFSLKQNYPNPFNPSTTIKFSLKESGNVSLRVYNMLGQLVYNLVDNQMKDAGTYTANFDASALSSGIYIYVLNQGTNVISKKMMLIK